MEMENQFTNRINLSELQNAATQIKSEIAKHIVGQEEMVELMLISVLADGHILLEGVPGVAKTLAAKLLARTISADFSRIQFTPDLMPSDIIGTAVYNQKINDFEFRKGPLFANIVLADEINRSPAKTQAALFEAMEERQITTDGTTYQLSSPFIVIATQNPIEQEGTYRLPEAQLDRFLFKIEVNYPTITEETQIIQNFHQRKNQVNIGEVKQIINSHTINELREKVFSIHVDDRIINYIAQFINGTRNNPSLFLGASPRASIAILNASKASAALRGRDFVTPDDIKFVAPHILKHRVMLTPEKEMEGVSTKDVIRQLLEKFEIPR